MAAIQDSFEQVSGARPGLPRWVKYGAPALLVIALMIGGGVMLSHRNNAPAPKPLPSLTVTTALPSHAAWADTLNTSGPIAAWQEASIGAQIGGYQLVDVLVNVGDQVKKGQVLARFDRAMLEANEAELQANSDQAAANEKRSLALQKESAIAEQNVLLAVTNAKVAKAQLDANKLQLRYADVVAPDDGVISARTATLGAVVPVGQELFRLIRQNRLEWRGELTATQLAQITEGQQISLGLPDGTSATATVRQTAPSLDGTSRLGIVYADIRPGSHARAGMYANGRVTMRQTIAMTVPAEAVVIRDGRNYVLTLADSNDTPHVALREVTTGRRQGAAIEIVSGLDAGTRLVVKGAGFLNDNDMVRLQK